MMPSGTAKLARTISSAMLLTMGKRTSCLSDFRTRQLLLASAQLLAMRSNMGKPPGGAFPRLSSEMRGYATEKAATLHSALDHPRHRIGRERPLGRLIRDLQVRRLHAA